MDIKLEQIRAFGPSILKVQIPEKLVKDLNSYVDQVINDEKKTKDLNHGKRLVADVKQEFIIDESNNENIYSRNFLRNEVIPLIKEKWPNVDMSINRMAHILDQQNTLYEKLIAEKYLLLSDEEGLLFKQLAKLDFFMRSEIIRFWLNQMGYATPNESQMKEIDKSFFQSRQGTNPVLKFQRDDGQNAGVVLSKYNNYLIAEKLDE